MAKKQGNNLNISLGVDIGELKKGFSDAIKVVQQSGKTTEESAKQMVDRISKQFDKLQGQTTMRGMIRQMENLGASMQQMGLDGTKAYRDVLKEAGKLKADQDDLKGRIEALRPDAPFNAMTTAIKTSAQAMAGVQGAMALFGQESEETQKALLKVQGALALIEGTKALDGFVDSFDQLKIILRANPLTAIASTIAAVAAAWVYYSNAAGAAVDKEKIIAGLRDQAIKDTEKEIGSVLALVQLARDESVARDKRMAAIKELNRISPEYLGNLTLENINTDAATRATNEYTDALIRQAIAKKAADKIAELALKRKEKEAERDSKLLQTTAGMGALAQKNAQFASKMADEVARANEAHNATVVKEYADEIGKLNDEIAVYTGLVNSAPDFISAIGGGKTTGGTKTPGTGTPAAKQPIVPVREFSVPIRKFSTDLRFATKTTEELSTAIQSGIVKSVDAAAIALQGLANINARATEQLWMDWESTMSQMQQTIQSFIVNGIGSLAESLGAALVSGDFKGFFDAFLSQFGDFLKQFGSMLIAWGVARLALLNSFQQGPTGAIQAIAAGAALVAIGSAMKTAMAKQSGTSSGGMGGYKTGQGFTPFASGGIVSGPTMGLVGEYPGAVNNPEVIAPLSDLQKMIGGTGGPMVIEHRISGNDLLVLINRAETYKKRNG